MSSTLNRRNFVAASVALAWASRGQARGQNGQWPNWADKLRRDLETMADSLTARLKPWSGPEQSFRPEDFGYGGEGLATAYIQAAIEAAAQSGGGTVLLSSGDYLSGTIVLKSHIRLMISKQARLLASTDLKDWPEHVAKRRTVQDTNMGMNQSLIFAENCQNIALAGQGLIDGQGAQFHGEETSHGTPGRPFILRIIDCQQIHISGVTLKDSPCWMQNYLNCDDLLIENLTVINQANWNNDGCDIDGCRHVIVRHCHFNSGDDAMCFKGAAQAPSENILVENCSFYSSCNGLKLGTDSQSVFRNVLARNLELGGMSPDMRHIKPLGADSGISWEVVDGGHAENILCHNIHIVRTRSPLFMRLDNRARVQPDQPKPNIGTLRRVVFEHITGDDNGPVGSYFIGIPNGLIEDVALRHIHIKQAVAKRPVTDEADIPELYNQYPDAFMIKAYGEAPAYGLWARHIKGLTVHDYQIIPNGPEWRPKYLMQTDCHSVYIS